MAMKPSLRQAIYLIDLPPAAGAVLSHGASKELRPDEIPLICDARLLRTPPLASIRCRTRDIPWELPVAANKKRKCDRMPSTKTETAVRFDALVAGPL